CHTESEEAEGRRIGGHIAKLHGVIHADEVVAALLTRPVGACQYYSGSILTRATNRAQNPYAKDRRASGCCFLSATFRRDGPGRDSIARTAGLRSGSLPGKFRAGRRRGRRACEFEYFRTRAGAQRLDDDLR